MKPECPPIFLNCDVRLMDILVFYPFKMTIKKSTYLFVYLQKLSKGLEKTLKTRGKTEQNVLLRPHYVDMFK